MKKKINKRKLQALQLNATERLQLSLFVANNRNWIARHAVPLEAVVHESLRRQLLEFVRLKQIEPHPVYELFLRLGRSSPASKSVIEMAVCQAFAAAGRTVKKQFAHALIRGDRAKVDVYVDSWLTGRNRMRERRPRRFLMGRR